MSNGAEPQEVQKALRHANLRITLETYVHWLPKKDRPRGLVGNLLRQADGKSSERPPAKIRTELCPGCARRSSADVFAAQVRCCVGRQGLEP